MPMILGAVVSASMLLYEAKVPTFGCNSSAEVLELQTARPDEKTFGQLLTVKAAYGQCVAIPQGTVVEGPKPDVETDTATLLINARNDPPGYLVPLKDFKPREADAGR